MSVTDRELLEAAAKAAGLPDYVPTLREGEGWICVRPPDEASPFQCTWSPLTDDGDALRLAVKLGFTVYVARGVSAVDPHGAGVPWAQFEHGDDPYAATRRAIVRAAASMASNA